MDAVTSSRLSRVTGGTQVFVSIMMLELTKIEDGSAVISKLPNIGGLLNQLK